MPRLVSGRRDSKTDYAENVKYLQKLAAAAPIGEEIEVRAHGREYTALQQVRLLLMVTPHTWEVAPGNKPPKIPQNSHLTGV